MSGNPIYSARSVFEGLKSSLHQYLEAQYHIWDEHLIAERRALLDAPGFSYQEPHLEGTPFYQQGSLYSALAIPLAAREILTLAAKRPNIGVFARPYVHQAEALEAFLGRDEEIIVTTGNGSVDFPCAITTLNKYANLGLKSQPGPWPKMAYYDTGYPMATLYFWPVPQSNIEFHMWTDQVFSSMTDLTTSFNMPRGYYLAFQYALAELLCPEYGIPVPPDVRRFAKEYKAIIKALNANPQDETSVDDAIVSGSGNDAGFILHGGFA